MHYALCIMHCALCIILLLSCATKPDIPEIPTTSDNLQIDLTIPTHGNPIDFDIYNQSIFVAEEQVGFTLYKTSGETIFHKDHTEGSHYWTETTLARYYPPHNLILVYDRKNDDHFHIFTYDEQNTTNPVIEITAPPASNTNNIRDIIIEQNPLSENRFRVYYGFFGESTNRFNKAYFEIGNISVLASERYINLENPIYNLIFHDDYIITARGLMGISIFDKDLDNVSTCATPTNARAVISNSNICYVADYAGLCLIDISDIANPTLLSQTPLPDGRATTLDIDDTHLYLAIGSDNGGGLYLFDISQPSQPTQISHLSRNSIGYTINKVMFAGDKLYVASRELGIVVISYLQPETRAK